MAEFKSKIDRQALREIADKGQAIYDRLVKEKGLEEKYFGLYIVINVDTGEYVLGKTILEASDLAKEKFPQSRRFHAQVGVPTYA
ncbi:MAG: hypothetical protein AAB338_02020 [Patescibacteria group bacterium]